MPAGLGMGNGDKGIDAIRYIHAADMHIDTPFKGLGKAAAGWGQRLRDATFTALARLADFCLSWRPDFLLLAGDIYDHENYSIRAHLALRDACITLDKAGIPVFMVHGNHDPFSSRLSAIDWPENTIIFGVEPQKHVLYAADGAPKAVIHGISHASSREERNLAALLRRDPEFSCFQAGLLHCNVDNALDDRYAPCSLNDLIESGMDAWALGHAHIPRVLSQSPFIAYAGNTQGLDISETGPKGCLAVTASRHESTWQFQADFQELSPIRWQKATVDVEGVDAVNEVEERLLDCVRQAAEEAPGGVILDMALAGRTALADELAIAAIREDMQAAMQPAAAAVDVLIGGIGNATVPLANEADNLAREDLLGEVSRFAAAMSNEPKRLSELAASAIKPLGRATRGILTFPGKERRAQLLTRATRICQDMLEKR